MTTKTTLIEKQTENGPVYWTGDEWISASVVGWRDAATWASEDDAQDELDAHADDGEFDGARVTE